MQTYAMSNIKFKQMKNHILKEQLFPFHICRKMIDLLPQVLVLIIHSHKKSMENRSENHLTLSMEKQVHTQRWHLRTVPVFEPCRLVLRIRFFQIKMIICSTTHKMRCKQTKRMKSSRISIVNW